MKNLFAAAASVAILGLSTSGFAAIIALAPGDAAAFPSAVPTFNVSAGQAVSLSVWGRTEGTGYLSNVNVAVFEGSAASWAGGRILTTNAFPSIDFLTGSAISPRDPTQFAVQAPNLGTETISGNANGGYSSGNLPWSFGGGNAVEPSGSIRSAGARFATLSGTINAGLAPGTYYLYLGRNGGGIVESPLFRAPGAVSGALGTGASVNSTTNFGFGDIPVGTAGAGPNGTAANSLSTNADAIFIVGSSGPSVSLVAGGANPAIVAGNGTDYSPTATNGGVFQFAGTNTGATLVAFDLVGGSGLPDGLTIPAGATASTNDLGIFGPGFDFVVNFGNLGSGPFTASISGLGAGVSLRATSAIPEPAALGFLAPVALLAARRRRA